MTNSENGSLAFYDTNEQKWQITESKKNVSFYKTVKIQIKS